MSFLNIVDRTGISLLEAKLLRFEKPTVLNILCYVACYVTKDCSPSRKTIVFRPFQWFKSCTTYKYQKSHKAFF
jgi:hypothetical protein